jgi:hypothetical protein
MEAAPEGPEQIWVTRVSAVGTQATSLHPTQFNVKRGPGRSSGWGLSGLDPVSYVGSPLENPKGEP